MRDPFSIEEWATPPIAVRAVADVRQVAGTRIIGTNDAGAYSYGAVIDIVVDGGQGVSKRITKTPVCARCGLCGWRSLGN